MLDPQVLDEALKPFQRAYVVIEDPMYQGVDPFILNKLSREIAFDSDRKYEEHLWDCEDIARSLVHHCKATLKSYKYSPAIGVIHYVTNRGESHVVNVGFTVKGELYFFEPQTHHRIHLSKLELLSIRFIQI